MKRFALALALVAVGCRTGLPQIPPATQHSVSLGWVMPVPTAGWAGCTTSAPCVFAIYRCTVSATVCADTSNVAWSELTTPATRVSGTSYTDNVSGVTAWYSAKTFQGTSSSAPSAVNGPNVVPGVPIAPALNTTIASSDAPKIAIPEATKELAKVELPSIALTSKVR